MNNFNANYRKILDTLQLLERRINFMQQKRKPQLSDIELIAIDLTSEYMELDSELNLFRNLPIDLLSQIERSVYNRRRRRLFEQREILRKNYAKTFEGFKNRNRRFDEVNFI